MFTRHCLVKVVDFENDVKESVGGSFATLATAFSRFGDILELFDHRLETAC